ncbi:class I SAM-dependent methyltransferase [Candidatus Saccharibacteria bacterium]|nr:class I SAM-dependent methyltransferase [Candidatus Saccharibacteria bacterium]
MANNDKNYHKTRFKFDPGRLKVWRAITKYLQPYVGINKTVLDLGCGYGDFINQIHAKKKYGLDLGPDVKDYINKDVNFINKASTSLEDITANTLDTVFSSNLFEHLDRTDIDKTMKGIKRSMQDGGTLILIGPNFRYAYKSYFDDYTHKTIFTHVSLADLMQEYGFKPVKVMPKFLPLTLKSRLPKSYYLTKLYLHSPFKPMGGQMLLIFQLQK